MTITESNNKTNMKEPIFKPGDRIYHPFFGWAEVIDIHNGDYKVVDRSTGKLNSIDMDYAEKMYSFTEYDPIKGGLSHERPLPKLKMGDIVKHTANEMYILVTLVPDNHSNLFSGVIIKGEVVGYDSASWNKEEFILIDKRIDLI